MATHSPTESGTAVEAMWLSACLTQLAVEVSLGYDGCCKERDTLIDNQ